MDPLLIILDLDETLVHAADRPLARAPDFVVAKYRAPTFDPSRRDSGERRARSNSTLSLAAFLMVFRAAAAQRAHVEDSARLTRCARQSASHQESTRTAFCCSARSPQGSSALRSIN